MIRFLGLLCLVEWHRCISAFEASSGLNSKHDSEPSVPHSVSDVTHSLRLTSSLAERLRDVNLLETRARELRGAACSSWRGTVDGRIALTGVPTGHWTSLTQRTFKDKMIENVKVTAEHETKQGALLRTTGHTFRKLSFSMFGQALQSWCCDEDST